MNRQTIMQISKTKMWAAATSARAANRRQTNPSRDSHKLVSEKHKSENEPKSRDLARNQHCQALNCYYIYILLLVQLVAQQSNLTTGVQATSHLNPSWISDDELQREQIKFKPANETKTSQPSQIANLTSRQQQEVVRLDFDETRAGIQPTGVTTKQATASEQNKTQSGSFQRHEEAQKATGSLSAAASSLQTAVVAVEPAHNLETIPRQQVAQRRSSQSFGPHFKLAHLNSSFSDEASSLDHHWSGTQPRAQSHTANNSQTSNAQVQFDEEHEQQSRRRHLIPRPIGDFDSTRRHDNETTLSSLAPKHADFQSDELHFDEHSGQTNRSRTNESPPSIDDDLDDSLPVNRHNSSNVESSTNGDRSDGHHRTPDPLAGIYYLPHGDKWNSESVTRTPARAQTAHHQLEDQLPPRELFEHNTSYTNPPDPSTFYRIHGPQHELWPINRLEDSVIQGRPSRGSNKWPSPTGLNFGFAPNNRNLAMQRFEPSGSKTYLQTTTQPPSIAYDLQFPRPLANNFVQQRKFEPNPFLMPPIYSSVRTATSRPQSFHQSLNSGHNEPFAHPRRRSRPGIDRATNTIINLGDVPSQTNVGGPRSFLRNYSPMQLIGGRPKKSILSTINEKLNHWTSESSGPNRDEMRLLESAFFEHDNSRPSRSRPNVGLSSGAYLRPNRMVRPTLQTHPGLSFSRPPIERPTFYGPIRQPTVAPASSTLNRFYGGSSSGTSGKQRHSQSGRPATRGVQHQGSQQPASFIPVVAVQMTRTSPAPSSINQQRQQERLNGLLGGSSDYQQTSANEIDQYLASKVGHSTASSRGQFNANERQKWDDSHSPGSASTSQYQGGLSFPATPDYQTATAQNTRHKLANGPGQNHETTVKGAVFGYLPHQADAPLMQAMSMLQQLPPVQSQSNLVQLQPRPDHLDVYSNANSDTYANQMDKSSQSADAATSFFDFQSLAAASQHPPTPPRSQIVDDQPSLALQLQANNFVQNDIAHPFSGAFLSASSATNHQLDKSFDQAKVKPLNVVYPNQQQFQYPAFQYLSPDQMGAYQAQLTQQLSSNPFLTNSVAGNTLDQYQAYLQSAASSPSAQQLFAAAELNPLLANSPLNFQGGHQFQPLDSFYDSSQKTQQRPLEDSSSSLDSIGQDSNSDTNQSNQQQEASEPPTETVQRNQALNNKGNRKRSSEFFANAGQLLLSALPLLLAPTLGLMFAASPSIPAARYHGLGQLASASNHGNFFASPNGQSGQHESAHYDNGIVMNASPEPQMFTPTPPGSHYMLGQTDVNAYHLDRPDRVEFAGQGSGVATSSDMTTTSPSTTTTSTTTTRPKGLFKSTASLPALTGLKMMQTISTNRSTNRAGQSTSKPFSAILTTLGPAFNLSSNSTGQNDAELMLASTNNKSKEHVERFESSNDTTTLVTPTLLLIEAQSEDDQPDGQSNAGEQQSEPQFVSDLHLNKQQSQLNSTERFVRQRAGTPNTTTTTTRSPATVVYDIGYQGADFDAQFPALRKSNPKKSFTATNSELNKFVKNKSQYQYADVANDKPSTSSTYEFASVAVGPVVVKENASRHDSSDDQDEGNDYDQPTTKLYPVSTWPTLRRRTVSLITSSGNKTLPDASDRHNADRFTHKSDRQRTTSRRRNSKLASSPNMTNQQNLSGGRKLNILDSFLLESVTTSGGKNEVRVSGGDHHRRRKRSVPQVDHEPVFKSTSKMSSDELVPSNSSKPIRLTKRRKPKGKKRLQELERRKDDQLTGEFVAANTSLASSKGSISPARVASQPFKWSLQSNASDEIINRVQTEQLSQDSSKRKSAIVAMITQVGDSDQDDQPADGQKIGIGTEPDSDEEEQLAYRELREQLVAKKMLLDRLATRATASNDFADQTPSNEADSFRLGGRGHFKPVPVADYAPIQDQQRETRFVSGRAGSASRDRVKSNTIELAEKTKRALAKFGSLLLEDTLQIPMPKNESYVGRNDRQRSLIRSKYSTDQSRVQPAPNPGLYDHQEGAATERYSLRATTQSPLLNDQVQDNWSRFYADRNQSSTGRHFEHNIRPDQSLVYQYPQSRSRNRQPDSGQSDTNKSGVSMDADRDSRYDRFESTRRHKQSQHHGDSSIGGVNGHAYPAANSSHDEFGDGGSQAVGFKLADNRSNSPDSTIDRYNHFLSHHHANRTRNSTDGELTSPTNSTNEQLDARYSTFSNYSTSAPLHYADHASTYQQDRHGPASRRHELGLPPPGYYADEPPSHNYQYDQQPHYLASPNSSYHGPVYHPAQRHTASSYEPVAGHHSNYRHGPHDDHSGPSQHHYPPPPPYRPPPPMFDSQRSAPTISPSVRYPGGHPYEPPPPTNYYSSPAYTADNYDTHHRHHQPAVSSTHAPASSSLAPHQTLGGSWPASSQSPLAHPRASLPAAGSRTAASTDSSRSINDYLKQAQFSDSDRDRLMASYLTCDGLLHDNDHCLERLSCEFSDPKNIEKANKLDRAVSSILLGHILINTHIPKSFKLRLKSASLFGYTRSGECSKFACNKLAKQAAPSQVNANTSDEDRANGDAERRR